MAKAELDAFLGGPPAEPEPPQAAEAPEPAPPGAAAEPAAPEPPQIEDDAEPPEPVDGEPLVPRRAFEALRHQRHDWKAKAVAAETRMEDLRRQLEEAKRPAPPPPPAAAPEPQPPPQIRFVDPTTDPIGYAAQVQQLADQRAVEHAINMNLNWSEAQLRKEVGAEKVAALKAEFIEAEKSDPTLRQKLWSQADPYGWAAKHLETLRLQREIGDDPAAYRAKLRAEFEAEQRAAAPAPQPEPPRVSPAAGMQPSLANARSVAGRSAIAWSGPTPLADILRR